MPQVLVSSIHPEHPGQKGRRNVSPDQFIGRVSENFFYSCTTVCVYTILVHFPDRLACNLGDLIEAYQTILKITLRLLALGDVTEIPYSASVSALCIKQWRRV